MKRKHDGSTTSGAEKHSDDRRNFIKLVGITAAGAALGGAGLLLPRRAFAAPGAVQRPIADFVDKQGSMSTFVEPAPDYFGWISAFAKPPVRAVSVDYAGLANEWIEFDSGGTISLETTTDGSVTERALADGRAEVTVVLHTKNALTYGFIYDPDSMANQFAFNDLVFGFRAPDVVAGDEPALAESHLKVVFKNTEPGAPLPDLLAALGAYGDPLVGFEILSLSIRANATGPLREEFGVPEGTPGRCILTQTGILLPLDGMGPGAVADGFPAERVEFRVTGQ